MITLIDRFEQMGRRGAVPALGLAALLLLVGIALIGWSFTVEEPSRWALIGMRGGGAVSGAFGVVYGMFGVRLLKESSLPSPEEIFPSLEREAFLRALREEPRPLCVCTRCRIHLPAQFSTGGCPRCSSSVDYYEVSTDEDMDMVLMSLD